MGWIENIEDLSNEEKIISIPVTVIFSLYFADLLGFFIHYLRGAI